MIPRFQNPHLLPKGSTQVTRAQIFNADQEGGFVNDDLEHLNEILHGLFGDISTYRAGEPKKAQALALNDAHMPFRLVSSSAPPTVISLTPKPLPLSQTRVPDCEDTEAEALQRMRRAQSTAVDIEWILRQSAVSHPSSRSHADTVVLLPMSFSFPNPEPPLLLIPKYPLRMPQRQRVSQRSATAEHAPQHSCQEGQTGYLCISPVSPLKQASLPPRRRRRKKVQKEKSPARPI